MLIKTIHKLHALGCIQGKGHAQPCLANLHMCAGIVDRAQVAECQELGKTCMLVLQGCHNQRDVCSCFCKGKKLLA